MRKKGRFKKVKEFVTRIKKIYREMGAALKISQEEMRKYTDRKRSEVEEYQVRD